MQGMVLACVSLPRPPHRRGLKARASAAELCDAGGASEGDAVFVACHRGSLRLGVVVGAMCTFRYVQPAELCTTTGHIQPLAEEETLQVSSSDILAVVSRTANAAALRGAHEAASIALALRRNASSE